jgi:predicted phosphoribosyltransferase
LTKKPVERLASGVLKQQYDPPVLAHKRQRPHRRSTVQFIPQSVFVIQPTNETWGRVFQRGKHGEHSGPAAISVITPCSAEDALTMLRQHCDAVGPT